MKRVFLVGTLAIMLIVGGLVVIVGGLGALYNESIRQNCLDGNGAQVIGSTASLSGSGLTVKGASITPVQERNAAIIVSVAFENGLSDRDATIAIMTAIQESGLVNVPYGYPGSTSAGLFSQIAAWGPYSVRMNPAKSSHMFYFGGRAGQRGLTDIPNRGTMSLGQAAQAVQHSAFPDAYATHEAEATAIVAAYVSKNGSPSVQNAVSTVSADCPSDDPVETFMQAVLDYEGEEYGWPDKDGSGLLSAAAKQAGFALPDSLSSFKDYDGDAESGVSVKRIPGSDIKSPEDIQRGDVVLWHSRPDGPVDRVGVSPGGTDSGSSFRLGTFNIYYSTGPRSGDWKARLDRSVRVITSKHVDVVGLQEVRPNQWAALQKKLAAVPGAPAYGIYPKTYGRSPYPGQSPIIWNAGRFRFIEGQAVPARSVSGKHGHVTTSMVLLEDKETGQQFYNISAHEPAGNGDGQTARLESARAWKTFLESLAAKGHPIFFEGDLNAPYRNDKYSANKFPGRNPDNGIYSILSRSPALSDAWDRYKGLADGTTVDGPGHAGDHIFVSSDVQVKSFDSSPKGLQKNGSDTHDTVFADVVIPGAKTARKNEATAVSYDKGSVAVVPFGIDQIDSVLRLSVSDFVNVSASGDWMFPLKKGTYHYNRNSYGPGMSGHTFHNGTDFGTSGATPPIVAMHNGEVVRIGWGGAWGNYYVVETGVPVVGTPGATYKYLYGHLSRFAPGIMQGQTVKAGQYLGNVGDTGNSFGEHLHLTICTDMVCTYGSSVGSKGSVDPVPFLHSVGINP